MLDMEAEAADCRRRAAECGDKARTTPVASSQRLLLEMELHWLTLAREYELAEKRRRLHVLEQFALTVEAARY